VEIDDVLAAGCVMQAIDVLRDELSDSSAAFEHRQRVVRVVWARQSHPAEAGEAPRPVALPRGLVAHELLIANGRAAFPFTAAVAVIGNARVGAAARTGQHEQPGVMLDETTQRVVTYSGCASHSLSRSVADRRLTWTETV
jgi:hypothetical protein